MQRKSLRALIPLLFLAHLAAGQAYVNIFDMQYLKFSETAYRKDVNARFNSAAIRSSLLLPLPMKNGNVILFGAEHITHMMEYDSDTSFSECLHSTALQAGGRLNFANGRWSVTALFFPRIAADLSDPGRDDWQFGGALFFTRVKSAKLKLKFGLYYNREFFGIYVMPLAGINWKAGERLNIFGLLPGSMNVEYSFSGKFTGGLCFRSITATFRTQGGDDSWYIREGHPFWADLQLTTLFTYYPLKNLAIFAGGGLALNHYFQAYDTFHDKISGRKMFNECGDPSVVTAGAAFRIFTE